MFSRKLVSPHHKSLILPSDIVVPSELKPTIIIIVGFMMVYKNLTNRKSNMITISNFEKYCKKTNDLKHSHMNPIKSCSFYPSLLKNSTKLFLNVHLIEVTTILGSGF